MGLTLFVILVAVVTIYAFSPAGQRLLAKQNLAWQTGIYAELGYESYQSGDYEQAGVYYERALVREPKSYSNAQSAARCYLDGGYTEKAAAMLKKCIEINPKAVEPYVYLRNLYPVAASRPWDVTQLLQGAYEATGDAQLKDLAN